MRPGAFEQQFRAAVLHGSSLRERGGSRAEAAIRWAITVSWGGLGKGLGEGHCTEQGTISLGHLTNPPSLCCALGGGAQSAWKICRHQADQASCQWNFSFISRCRHSYPVSGNGM